MAAGFLKTFSGSLTTALAQGLASKVLNAAGNAKEEGERRQAEGLQKAQAGSLFTRALQHEFGGDLYSRTIGNFDPRKKFATTDRTSNKNARFKAQFADLKPQKKQADEEVKKAEEELLKDDDSLPVKDEQVRAHVSKVLGRQLQSKFTVLDYSMQQVTSELSSVKTDLVNTQQLIVDQNELLGSKFDTILGIFQEHRDFQKKIVDEGKAASRAAELRQKQDLSTTRALQGIKSESGAGINLGGILKSFSDILGAKFRGKNLKAISAIKDALDVFGSPGLRKGFARGLRKIANKTFGDAVGGKNRSLLRRILRGQGTVADIRLLADKSLSDLPVPEIFRKRQKRLSKGSKGPARPGAKTKVIGARQQSAFLDFAREVSEMEGRPMADVVAEMVTEPKSPLMRDLRKSDRLRDTALGKRNAVNAKTKKLRQKAASRFGPQLARPSVLKAGIKKSGAKGIGKLIPGVGTAIALGEAAIRAAEGDTVGAALSIGSAIPILGWGFTAFDIARDFGFDPLNTLPRPKLQGYETGTGLSEKGPAILHGTELRLTNRDREDAMQSASDAFQSQTNMLVSSALALGEATGTTTEISREIKKSKVKYDFVRLPMNSDVGRSSTIQPVLPAPGIRETLEKRVSEAESAVNQNNNQNNNNNNNNNQDNNENIEDPNGPGGNQEIPAPVPGAGSTTIQFHGGQGVDASGEPGLDFSFGDYMSNYSVFPGTVVEVGPLYGAGYGNVVVVRSVDPHNGKEFDALYAHFPNGGIVVKEGQKVSAGTRLGAVGWDEAKGQPLPGAGSMTGPHTSLDFFEPNTKKGQISGPYSNAAALTNYIIGNANRAVSHMSTVTRPIENPVTSGEEGGEGGPGTEFKNDIERRVYEKLKAADLPDAHIAAIMANFDVETMGFTRMKQLNDGPGRGLAQWETPGRWDHALKWYASKGKNPNNLINDIEAQIEWTLYEFGEIPTDEEGRPMLPNGFRYNLSDWIASSNDPQELAMNWLNWYEAAGVPHTDQRMTSALNYVKRFNSMQPPEEEETDLTLPPAVDNKVGSGIPFFPDLTIMKGIEEWKKIIMGIPGAIEKGINDGLEQGRERERNTELLKLLPGLRNKSKDLQSSSQIMEDMEQQLAIQTVVINNSTVVRDAGSTLITSNNSNNNPSKDYLMAVLGA